MVTVSATTTSYISITSTDTSSNATATDVSTAYTTVITVVTRSDVGIATEVKTITVMAGKDQRKRRALTADSPLPSMATTSAKASASPCHPDQNPLPYRPKTIKDS